MLKKIITNVLLILISILFAIAFLEIITRLTFDQDYYYSEAYKNYRNDSRLLTKSNIYFNYTDGLFYKYNGELSSDLYTLFDTSNYSIEKNKSKIRIAIIGDSFTEGLGLSPETRNKSSYPIIAEEQLNRKIKNESFEVLTFGLRGLNTMQEENLYFKLVKKYDPDIVVVQFCHNDFETKFVPLFRKDINQNGDIKELFPKTNVIKVNGNLIPSFKHLSLTQNEILLSNSKLMQLIALKFNTISTIRSINHEKSLQAIESIKKETKENNREFIIILFPYGGPQFRNPCNTKHFDILKGFCHDKGIYCYDLCYYFDPSKYGSNYENQGYLHYNEEGYKIAGESLAEMVINRLE